MHRQARQLMGADEPGLSLTFDKPDMSVLNYEPGTRHRFDTPRFQAVRLRQNDPDGRLGTSDSGCSIGEITARQKACSSRHYVSSRAMPEEGLEPPTRGL